MKHMTALALAGILAASPVAAEPEAEGGLIQRGFQGFFRNLMQDDVPQLNNLSGALEQMAPVLKDLAVLVDDLENYHPPPRQENGDIIIRRRADAPPAPPLGDSLRDLTDPSETDIPIDPDAPQIEL
ncbi:hypothetical protein [Paracoccus sp. JM45]|uniref:hypothetical protein n=1 Tax=Paracoccus sp. JM45 TaxID=2283626 RepID=UPI0011C374A6|nr:hypothetical protein [Paracoccus sp. JM45]